MAPAAKSFADGCVGATPAQGESTLQSKGGKAFGAAFHRRHVGLQDLTDMLSA